MRFHIGFSKRIKTKTLIEILGLLFLGFLAFCGIDKVHADTPLVHFDLSSNDTFSGNYTYAMTNNMSSETLVDSPSVYFRSYSLSNPSWSINAVSFTPYNGSFSSSSTFGYTWNKNNTNYQGNGMRYFKNLSIRFPNKNFCSSNFKSNDITLYLHFGTDSAYSTMMSLNSFTPGSFYDVRIAAIDTNNDWFSTQCVYQSSQTITSTHYLGVYTCSNVYTGTNNHTITNYSIDVFNTIEKTDNISYNSSNYWILSDIDFDVSDTYYVCSTDNPVIDFATADLPSGVDLDNFLADARDNFDEEIPGIDISIFDIEYPESIQEIISLPLYVLNNIVERSNSCTPYELDLSGLTRLGNNGNNYDTNMKIQFPCMRTKLSSLLGSLYNLIDILLAAIVFYNVGMAIIQLIEAITDGVDLWSFYFDNTKEGKLSRLWFWGDRQ